MNELLQEIIDKVYMVIIEAVLLKITSIIIEENISLRIGDHDEMADKIATYVCNDIENIFDMEEFENNEIAIISHFNLIISDIANKVLRDMKLINF